MARGRFLLETTDTVAAYVVGAAEGIQFQLSVFRAVDAADSGGGAAELSAPAGADQ